MSEQLIDAAHPTIQRLEAQGFRVTMHVYLRDGKNSVAFTAHNKQTKRTHNGRSRAGDRDEALADLAWDAGLEISTSPECDTFDPHDPFAGL